MRVVLIQKPDYVQSMFICGFPVGGFNVIEKIGEQRIENKTGSAHYLEHQMFRYKGEDVTDLFAQLQSQTNAFTSYSETAYYFNTTSNIEKPLNLLLDFVQDLDINEATVEKERGIILSEYAMYDQNPEMRLLKELLISMYKNHPLKYDILGSTHDISEMKAADLESFYRRNYDPKNAVLVGMTGKELEPIMKQIEEHEKNYPSQMDELAKCCFEEEEEEVARSFYTFPMDIHTPYAGLAYKLKPRDSIEEALKYDLAVGIWLDSVFGPMNPEYQSWLDEHIISQAFGAEADFSKEHGYVLFYAQTDKIEEFRDLIKSLTAKKPTIEPAVFESLKIQMVARNIRTLDHMESLTIEILRSYLVGYDYWEWMKIVETLSLEEVNTIIQSLDFSNLAEVVIETEETK